MSLGFVVIGDHQFFRGYTLFLCKRHAGELHELEPGFRSRFLVEMSVVAEAVAKCFRPRKLNYELLGNYCPHLHWHLFPRYPDDPNPTGPVHRIPEEVRSAEETRPSPEELEGLKHALLTELRKTPGANIVRAATV